MAKQDDGKPTKSTGLPLWLTATVVLALVGTLAYNVIVVGPEGIPNSYVLGGLLGAYLTGDRLLRNRDGEDQS